jgi:calcineurin-like phosphoesterase family protein
MSNIFFISDQHYSHENILTFRNSETDELIRPEFSSAEEMNEVMIENHNEVVGDFDKVYFLGDLGFKINTLAQILSRLRGKKRLILGNHDYSTKKDFMMYFEYFEKIMESRRMGELLFTHRPVLLGENEVRIKANCHGHIHEQNIDHDPRYLNISVEQIDYTPVSLDWIIDQYKDRGIELDVKL